MWALAFVVCWSSGFVGAALGGEAPVPALLAWRYLLTAALLGTICLARAVPLSCREAAQQAVLGLLSHAVFLGGVFASAARGVDAGTAALVCALQPMLVIAAGRLWWGDRIGQRRGVGLVLGLAAVALAVGGVGASGGAALLLPVASLIGLTASALLERRWHPRTPVLPALTVQVAAAALALCLWASLDGGFALPVSGRTVAALAWLIVLSGFGGYLGFTQCLRRLGASATSSLLYLTPPVTTLWAWLMLGTVPTGAQLAALALGAAAVMLILLPGGTERGGGDGRAAGRSAPRGGAPAGRSAPPPREGTTARADG